MARRRAAELEALYQAHPDSLVFARVADSYLAAGRSEPAVEVCLRGIETHPSYAAGYYVLAKCYVEQGQYDGARSALERVTRTDPDHIGCLELLTGLCEKTGDTEGAIRLLRVLSTVDPLNPGVSERIASLERCLPVAARVSHVQEVGMESQGTRPEAAVADRTETRLEAGDEQAAGVDSAADRIALPADPPSHKGEGGQAPHRKSKRASSIEAAVEQDVNRLIHEIGMDSAGAGGVHPSGQSSVGNLRPGIATVTLAELYASQGVLDRSLEILKSLLLQNPDDEDIRARIRELESRQSTNR